MAGTAADAIADIGLRLIKEREARIADLEAALRAVDLFLDGWSFGDEIQPEADALAQEVRKVLPEYPETEPST